MPKEITHWWLAAEALRALGSPSGGAAGEGGAAAADRAAFAAVLEKNRSLFLLGAVGPDFLFYYLFGPELERFRAAAMVLHGSDGGDTLAVLARTAERYGKTVPDGILAFLYGYACHVSADAVFHPLVLYFVGKGTEDARYNHHLFESVLDLYVTEIVRPGASVPRLLRDLTAGMEMDRRDFLELLGAVSFGGGEYDREALAKCLRRYEFLQAAFRNPAGQAAARLLARWKPGLRHFEPSFYQKRFYAMAPAFGRPLAYRHPVTGGEMRDTIFDLRDRMAARCVEAAEFFTAGPDPAGRLRGLRGPNLETGIHGDNAGNIRYTAPGGPGDVFGPERN